MSSFMAGFATCAVLAGLIWGYRKWLTSQALKAEQSVKDTAAKVTAKP